ncbi:unnamed protein product [Thelazia callipaeda]|uniref:RWD domain-containing protein n=1 Tax=Thelazia callipaeda TaxID=103827 RepID=A0A0N5CRQ4_THECL|nr:unnamed protein product [Thelazia callipaeda]
MMKLTAVFILIVRCVLSLNYKTGDNSTVDGCSSHCSIYDNDLSCLNRTLEFYELLLLEQLGNFIAVQISIDQWYKFHMKHVHRNYTELKEEVVAKLAAKLVPEDIINEKTIETVMTTLFENVEEASESIEEIPYFSCPLPCEYRHNIWRNISCMDGLEKTCKQSLVEELSFLKSMYTSEELRVYESDDEAEIGQVTQLIMNLHLDGAQYEVMIQLSAEYPVIMKPSVFVRSSSFDCDSLNRELRHFIENEVLGTPLIWAVIQWINDHIIHFKVASSTLFLGIVLAANLNIKFILFFGYLK